MILHVCPGSSVIDPLVSPDVHEKYIQLVAGVQDFCCKPTWNDDPIPIHGPKIVVFNTRASPTSDNLQAQYFTEPSQREGSIGG